MHIEEFVIDEYLDQHIGPPFQRHPFGEDYGVRLVGVHVRVGVANETHAVLKPNSLAVLAALELTLNRRYSGHRPPLEFREV